VRLVLFAMLLPVALARGCQCGGDTARTDSAPVAAPTSMSANAARLKAAMAISSLSERDEALAKLAADAAAQGDTDVTAKAVEGVVDVTFHDKTATGCALALAKAGKTASATDLARTIRSQTQRDATLAQIAKGG